LRRPLDHRPDTTTTTGLVSSASAVTSNLVERELLAGDGLLNVV
jgi:hypothetical protein